MKKVKNNKTIEVIIPIEDVTSQQMLQNLILQGLILELDTERLNDNDGNEFKKIYFNNLEYDLIQYFLTQHYELNMLNGKQTPYVYIDVDKLEEVPSFLEEGDERTLAEYAISYVIEDEMVYVEIGHYNGDGRSGYTNFNEITTWATEYGVTNVQIIDKKVNINETE